MPHLRDRVADELRRRIITGDLPPGAPVPSRRNLEAHYGISLPIVQKALQLLEDEGYVISYPSRGTQVALRPPHLHRFGLVFPQNQGWSTFWRALSVAGVDIEQQGHWQLPQYWPNLSDDPEECYHRYDALRHQLSRHRLGGLIIVGTPPTDLGDWHPSGLPPCVLVADAGDTTRPRVSVDYDDFYRQSVAELATRGAHRLGVLLYGGNFDVLPSLRDAARDAGMTLDEDAIHGLYPGNDRWMHNIVRLLMRDPARRPDGLIIADDHLVPGVTDGLIQLGLVIGRDVHVVAHTNWPAPTPTATSVQRIGFDAAEVLDAALQLLTDPVSACDPALVRRIPARRAPKSKLGSLSAAPHMFGGRSIK